MIPRLSHKPLISKEVHAYLDQLQAEGFQGECETAYASRLSMATDNSIYQFLPQAVLFPKNTADVVLLAKLAGKAPFRHIAFTPRGGGTGTNGQSLNYGITVDLSRHMKHIQEVNAENGWVRVEAGVVKDQLNRHLKPFGYFFSPDLSTSNRATLGGMINTDASGQGSLVYGKTSDHILNLTVVLLGGEVIETGPLSLEEAKGIMQQGGGYGRLLSAVLAECIENKEEIERHFPPLNRFLTGYDLKHVYNPEQGRVDLSRLIAGSEGTLAFVTEARLHIQPLPAIRRLVNIHYKDFDSALRHAPFMLAAKALSVETIDSKVLSLAREDIVWHSVKGLLAEVSDHTVQGLNIVEFAGDEAAAIEKQVEDLCQLLVEQQQTSQNGVMGFQVCHSLADIERIYTMRKKAVGLLGNTKGEAKPVAFVEDTCVPPASLADYITEFRALLDSYHLSYGMFGHVDSGVLHVRPALNLYDARQRALVKEISDKVTALTAHYGGLLWGEHGKGIRGEYTEDFFGSILYRSLRKIKAAFDPYNQLNPGKICVPWQNDGVLMGVESPMRGLLDQQVPSATRQLFSGAMTCNGNGLCFSFDEYTPMCPSMKVSADRVHSPKGRAGVVREWLTLLASYGVSPEAIAQQSYKRPVWWNEVVGFLRREKNRSDSYDFSHEVMAALSGCLACKACASQCPVKIDVPAFKARFLEVYYTRYVRPLRDYLVAGVEYYAPLMARYGKIFNWVMHQKRSAGLIEKYFRMVDMPSLSQPTLAKTGRPYFLNEERVKQLSLMKKNEKTRYVAIVQDAFTSFYEARLVMDFIILIEKLGFIPLIIPFLPNGKPQHVKGFLQLFRTTATKAALILSQVEKLGIPMVGIDPALTLCYRDEYTKELEPGKRNFRVLLFQEWLFQQIQKKNGLGHFHKYLERETGQKKWYLLGHCTETTMVAESFQQWKSLFAYFGLTLENVAVGCCGMAGSFGHESEHKDMSQDIYKLSWQVKLSSLPDQFCLTTGYSCRSQAKRVENKQLRHPVQALLSYF
ncbi:D-2-hydroxyglutarate dehydrogenase YdiJ [Entomobacter blattae]|uniref:D-2-hydroxyglutarate dehydrogenase n=1 Tax=Entomobacter blattae TaxID=2762277 RepID=A0A7H1NSC4_9PROT|nr:FAD-binding and (Fe-S)-binding domain-containing protein [Entomobacter blattae]QNT78684.1 hypothetical protein JGUZn3_14600 [Entomobacter blattae]